MAWASARDIRIVVKGTGHDMNGRSSGAYSMSVWTHNFKKLEFNSAWALPDGNETTDVVITGSGNNWGVVYTAADKVGKSVVGGGASSVGLGGYIQGGGHGPLSSTYGLAADQVLQATIVTTEGQILVANAENNTDLFWAIRGGGGGQYGVVTEYVLKTHPAPSSVVTDSLSLLINGTDNSSTTAAWNAYTVLIMSLPDLMDAGLAGAAFTKTEAGLIGLSHSQGFYGYNISSSDMTTMIEPVMAKMRAQDSNTTLSITWEEPVTYPNFTSFFQAQKPTSESAGGGSVMSSRLLGRAQLTNNVTQEEVTSNLQKVFITQESNGGGYIIIGLQGGLGPAKVPENMRDALNPVWRTSYLHTIALGATVNTTADPKTTLTAAADWLDENLEAVWREWAPDTGSYMNEANPYNTEFKHDYYGTSYDQLLEIKKKYDPTESLYILTGVGSDGWDYDLSSGKLCRTT